MADPLMGISLPVGEAAKLLMLSPRRLQQLTQQGHAPKPERGVYPLVPLLQGYLRFLKAQERLQSRDTDDELKQLRIRKERRREATEEGDLLVRADAEFFIEKFAALVVLELNNLPARATRDLEQRDHLQDQVDEVLQRVGWRHEDVKQPVTDLGDHGRRGCGIRVLEDCLGILDADP